MKSSSHIRKKAVFRALAVCLVLTLAACAGEGNAPTDAPTLPTRETVAPTETPTEPPAPIVFPEWNTLRSDYEMPPEFEPISPEEQTAAGELKISPRLEYYSARDPDFVFTVKVLADADIPRETVYRDFIIPLGLREAYMEKGVIYADRQQLLSIRPNPDYGIILCKDFDERNIFLDQDYLRSLEGDTLIPVSISLNLSRPNHAEFHQDLKLLKADYGITDGQVTKTDGWVNTFYAELDKETVTRLLEDDRVMFVFRMVSEYEFWPIKDGGGIYQEELDALPEENAWVGVQLYGCNERTFLMDLEGIMLDYGIPQEALIRLMNWDRYSQNVEAELSADTLFALWEDERIEKIEYLYAYNVDWIEWSDWE